MFKQLSSTQYINHDLIESIEVKVTAGIMVFRMASGNDLVHKIPRDTNIEAEAYAYNLIGEMNHAKQIVAAGRKVEGYGKP